MIFLENDVITENFNAETVVDFRNSRRSSEIGRSMTDESIESNQPQNSNDWSELPSLAIEKIYSFLNRTDQCRMSLVCRRWAKEFSSPAIWKSVKFYLPEHDCLSDIYPEVIFARKYGNMFRNVDVICKRMRVSSLEALPPWRQLKLFLNILTLKSQLMSLRFVNLGKYFRHLNEVMYTSVFRAIIQLLETQKNLRTLEFHDCYFSFEESVELLERVSENSGNTLRKLTLKGFVDVDLVDVNPNMDAATNLCAFMQKKLENLRTIDADYFQVFENILPGILDGTCTFGTTNKHLLSKIILNCAEMKGARFKGIHSMTWKYLRQSSPDLKVELYFVAGAHPQREIELFIVPGIPLKYLDFRLKRLNNSVSNLSFKGLFNHLRSCKCYEHLESLYITWMRPIADESSVLIPFLQSCSQLKSFQLTTYDSENAIEKMFNSEIWNESHHKFSKELCMTAVHVRNGEGYSDYLSLSSRSSERLNRDIVVGSEWW